MIVISDTTPLISLMKIGHLDVLEKLFGEIVIPGAVYNELTSTNKFKEEALAVRNCPFLKVVEVTDFQTVSIVMRSTGLDIGETEAIVLSDCERADMLLIDEAKGRRIAKLMNIRIMGTIGILATAFQEKLLDSEQILEAVAKLKEERRFISESLYEGLINMVRNNQ